MFRITHFLRELEQPTPAGPHRDPPGPVVVWNLIRRCNLACRHCYSTSADKEFSGELSTAEVVRVMEDLRRARVPFLILSGGEPLLRPDILEISRHAKSLGFGVALSSNGTLIDSRTIAAIADVGYDYVGVSLDGLDNVHDRFRGRDGAFADALAGLRRGREAGLKMGLRFTMTRDNAHQLEAMLDLLEREDIDRFYFSHLNYAGRGNRNRDDDVFFQATRRAMDLLFERCWTLLRSGRPREFVSGNNDADGVYLLHWVAARHPDAQEHMRAKLRQWGGNASGINVANIDNRGNVHPDTMWWHHTLGNVRERSFGELWHDLSDPLLAGLKLRPRPVTGRCGVCAHLDICNGNTRVRAQRLTGDPWAEDPGCYLPDDMVM